MAEVAHLSEELRRSRDDLRELRETLELVGRATNDIVWDWDLLSGRVTRSHAIESFGYSVGEAAGSAWWMSRVHPDDLAHVQASIARGREDGQAMWSAQYRFRRADGTYASVLDRGYLVRDAAGRAVRMIGTVVDLTERERSRELARRGAASADLLARASHELRTPMNAILGFSELLEQRLGPVLEPRERHYLKNVRVAGEHLLSLVDRLLQIAKADSGRLKLDTAVVALDRLVAPVCADFAAEAGRRGIAFSADLPDASVRVDPARLSSVLRELIANALAATPQGGSVTLLAAIPDGDLVLEVIDNGRGIPLEARDGIFEVFQRVHDDGDPARTGLGLALCRELVEAHGGILSFESDPGRRTVFRIRLPQAAWRSEQRDRVLIVDDEPNDADLAATVAGDAGFPCEVVGSIAEARAAILRDLPTAIVLDLHLPDGLGIELLDELGSPDRHVPVVVITAYDDDLPERRGMVRMTKPIEPARLAAWLREVTATPVAP